MARKTKTTQIGLVRVTYELLEEFLNLSAPHKIVDIYATSQDRKRSEFIVKITGPKLPIKIEGCESMIVPLSDITEK